MKVQLLVSSAYDACRQAEAVWSRVTTEQNAVLEVLDIDGSQGRHLAEQLALKTLPAVLIDGHLTAVGVQSEAEARGLLLGG